MNRRFGAFASAAVALAVAACDSSSPSSAGDTSIAPDEAKSNLARDPASSLPDGGADVAVAANNAFALDLYAHVRSASPSSRNLWTSPISASMALTMAYAGARGTTATEMAGALHFDPAAMPSIFTSQNVLTQALASRAPAALAAARPTADGGIDQYRLDIVNSVWGQKGYPWASTFLDIMARSYGTGIFLEDFVNATDPARQAINAWVSSATDGLINGLLPQGTLDSMTRMVIVNAVSLELPWQQPFDASATRPGTFTRGDGSTVTTDFMVSTQLNEFPYVNDGQAQILTLPLATGDVQVNFALPYGDLGTYESGLTAASALVHYNAAFAGFVDVAVPKMSFTAAPFSLASALQAMGMKQAFDAGAADFTGLCANPPDGGRLFVKDVLQKASLDMFENGVEAAAGTAALFRDQAIAQNPIVFHLNKPFAISIVDRTGAVLFLGHVADPTDVGSP
jgi:serpin B